MDDSYQPKNNKPILIGLLLGVILLFLVTTTYIISHFSKGASTQTSNGSSSTAAGSSGSRNTGSNSTKTTKAALPGTIPQVQVKQWQTPAAPANVPTISNVYTYKQNYSQDEVKAFASKLFTYNTVKQSGDTMLLYTMGTSNGTNGLRFNTKSGSFFYITNKGLTLPSTSTDLNEKITAFLRSVNMYDSTMKVTATYKKRNQPGLVYAEVRHNWPEMGMPVLNFIGLLNLPETQPLSTLTLQSGNANLSADPTITNTSDNRDGLKRPNEFNTMTIVLNENEDKIFSIESNLRQIQTTTTVRANLLPYQTLVSKLKNNQYDFMFTSPAGTGAIAWNKVYPGNKGIADTIQVQEVGYTYLEQMPNQPQALLQPYVVFRGTAVLESGYRVNVLAAVNANSQQKSVLGAYTKYLAQSLDPTDTPDPNQGDQGDGSSDPGQQQGTGMNYDPAISDSPPPQQSQCSLSVGDLQDSPRFTFMGVTLALYSHRISYQQQPDGTIIPVTPTQDRDRASWYYIPEDPQNTTADEVQQAWTTIHDHLVDVDLTAKAVGGIKVSELNGKTGDPEVQTLKDVMEEYQRVQDNFSETCPIVFSGVSPNLFIYAPNGTKVSIAPHFGLTYLDPDLNDDAAWNVTVKGTQNLTVNGAQRPYVYYEHTPVQFTTPTTGWVVAKNKLDQLAQSIATELKLNALETKRLLFELQTSSKSVTADTVFVGLVDQKEVNEKLPLTISPQPKNLVRLHFYVGQVKNAHPEKPVLNPITRTSYMILEIGSTTE